MKRTLLILTLLFFAVLNTKAVNDETDTAQSDTEFANLMALLDSTQKLVYQTGEVKIGNGIAVINVPQGFKYLNPKQTEFVMTKLWNNPPDGNYLGMLVPDSTSFFSTESWVFTIQYDAIGYVSDKDANDVDYDDLLKDMKKESEEDNVSRRANGYTPMDLLGWASTPYYDSDKKILHWAKEFKVEDEEINTLNYNVRILGRKGVLVLNAIAGMPQLAEVKKNINPITESIVFESGSKYSDFNPDVDDVAAWTIGGLVAGKVLAKVGFFAVIAKFGKVIILGLIAAGGVAFRFFTGRKKDANA